MKALQASLLLVVTTPPGTEKEGMAHVVTLRWVSPNFLNCTPSLKHSEHILLVSLYLFIHLQIKLNTTILLYHVHFLIYT